MKTRLVLLVAAALASAAGCGGDVAPEGVDEPRSATSERTGNAGATVELPAGWHTTAWDDGYVTDPLTRIVVASAPIRPKDTACQVAQYNFAADAVALVVLEWHEPRATLPERPASFTSRELPVQPPPAIECFDGSGGSAQFIDHGRSFGAYLLVGPRAPGELVDEARSVLDTLLVEWQQRAAHTVVPLDEPRECVPGIRIERLDHVVRHGISLALVRASVTRHFASREREGSNGGTPRFSGVIRERSPRS